MPTGRHVQNDICEVIQRIHFTINWVNHLINSITFIYLVMLKIFKESYFLLLVILLSANTILYPQSIKFEHITVKNGLSNNKVNSVIQDKMGFIWFGTDDGLNRFDGYSFKIFRHETNDSNSISDNSIWALHEDSNGNIWIGTKSGVLNKYDPISERFLKWNLQSNNKAENSIKSIYEDRIGNIWIGTYKGGLYKLNLASNRIDHWISNPEDEKSLTNNFVLSIIEDNSGNMLIGTYNGFNKLNPKLPERGFQRFYSDPKNKKSISGNIIWGLSQSSIDSNIVWLGTHLGLTKYNTENSNFNRIEIANPNNLQYGNSSGSVIDEIIDNEEIIWADSYAGLIRLNLTSGKAERFINDKNNPQSLIDNRINKTIKDRSGVLWVVTENGISYSTSKSTLFNSFTSRNPFYYSAFIFQE